MIHKLGKINGEWVALTPFRRPDLLDDCTEIEFFISVDQVARPGVYDSERAARYAFRFKDEDLRALQERVNAEHEDPDQRVITFEMLQGLARQEKQHGYLV